MQVTKKNLTDTSVQLTLVADADLLKAAKQETLQSFAGSLKLPGFREGKAPLSIVEKQVDQARLQSEFVEHALQRLYLAALEQENLRPVSEPKIKISKFVPFATLEVEVTVEIVGDVKLPDYKKMKFAKEKVNVTAKEIDDVIANLRTREAEKKDVDRAAKEGDEVWINFTGVDAKTKEAIKGADGKDYPLVLGSNTFIPGFEPELIGTKAGGVKTFTLTFPKDYGVSTLQNRKVEFTTTTNKVQEVVLPKLDDEFAAKVGPFKTIAELKADVKKQLEAEKEYRADQKYADDLLTRITEKTKVAIPEALVNEQIERLERDQRQNLMYRGQTWQEYLDSEGLTEETFRAKQRPVAELRVKAGLVLSEIADLEKIEVTAAELDAQMQALSARYPDAKMQAELAKPEARRDIASRVMTEKTIARLTEYATAK
ncbi:MAG TPA: trigger factor [Candidatus Saccharimonadales bacterium]|jgi:trigger factor|nr:trigger factor [Candidatus Saccharimonadales bacterium]